MLVSIREVFWCRKCPISYSEKGDIDVQIERRREGPSMSDFRQDRKSANPLLNKVFLLWHGPCMGFCERISETSSMIMRTENAIAEMKTALLPATKPAKGRRVMVEAGDCAGFKHLNGPGKLLA
ncbi:hypothetical protein NKJ84_28985 [Mesorhizobium sp. M0048]|uniref:hypothetical protein n=1 Tax=Mesorhizobium sp. M0048 TaxID=2956860 RepID=UPI00333B46AA